MRTQQACSQMLSFHNVNIFYHSYYSITSWTCYLLIENCQFLEPASCISIMHLFLSSQPLHLLRRILATERAQTATSLITTFNSFYIPLCLSDLDLVMKLATHPTSLTSGLVSQPAGKKSCDLCLYPETKHWSETPQAAHGSHFMRTLTSTCATSSMPVTLPPCKS